MTGALVIGGLLAVWVIAAVVVGLLLGRAVALRDRQGPRVRPGFPRGTRLVVTGPLESEPVLG